MSSTPGKTVVSRPRFPWKFKPRPRAPRAVYLHFICCTVTRRIREAVAVKPTLKKLRRDKFPKGPVLTRHSLSVPEWRVSDDFFFLPHVWVRGRASTCALPVYVFLNACKRGARGKNYEEPSDSEFRSVLCQLRYAIRGAAHVTRTAMQRCFLVGCARLWKSAALLDRSKSENTAVCNNRVQNRINILGILYALI